MARRSPNRSVMATKPSMSLNMMVTVPSGRPSILNSSLVSTGSSATRSISRRPGGTSPAPDDRPPEGSTWRGRPPVCRLLTSARTPLLRTLTAPQNAKALTLITGDPGSGRTFFSLRSSFPPMMAMPPSSTSIPSGTMMSMAPITAMALMTASGPSTSALRRSSTQPPMTATALVFSRSRHRPLRREPPMIETVQRVSLRPLATSGMSGSTGTAALVTSRLSRPVRSPPKGWGRSARIGERS